MLQTDVESETFACLPLEAADSLPVGTEDYEEVRILVIGYHRGVNSTIRTLHVRQFAEVGQWSPLLSVPNSSKVMRILTRRIRF